MRDLMHFAAQLGVCVTLAHIDDDPSLLGYYVHEQRLIVVRLGMTFAQTRSVLAHELGHAYYGHECVDERSEERAADILAARLLVNVDEYARAERVNPHPAAIAEELDVTVEVVEHFQSHCLQRVGAHTYALARAGARQWLTKTLTVD